jgi:hypothetical protein
MHPYESHAAAEIRNCFGHPIGVGSFLFSGFLEFTNALYISFGQLIDGIT